MRDPNRIDPIMEKLTAVWKLHPDWRLCQVLANIAVLTGWKESDLFHFEDDELLKGLNKTKEPKYVEKIKGIPICQEK